MNELPYPTARSGASPSPSRLQTQAVRRSKRLHLPWISCYNISRTPYRVSSLIPLCTLASSAPIHIFAAGTRPEIYPPRGIVSCTNIQGGSLLNSFSSPLPLTPLTSLRGTAVKPCPQEDHARIQHRSRYHTQICIFGSATVHARISRSYLTALNDA